MLPALIGVAALVAAVGVALLLRRGTGGTDLVEQQLAHLSVGQPPAAGSGTAAAETVASLTPAERQHLESMLRRGQYLAAIDRVREHTGLSLAAAKQAVDGITVPRRPDTDRGRPPGRFAGPPPGAAAFPPGVVGSVRENPGAAGPAPGPGPRLAGPGPRLDSRLAVDAVQRGEIERLLRAGRTMSAIELLRQYTGLRMAEAKVVIDQALGADH